MAELWLLKTRIKRSASAANWAFKRNTKRAYIIADNRLALDAGWDDEMLRVEFAELADDGFNLGLTGFEVGELESIKLEQTTEDLSGDKNNISSLSERF